MSSSQIVTPVTVVIIVRRNNTTLAPALKSCIDLNPEKIIIVDSSYNERQKRYCQSQYLKKLHSEIGSRISVSSFSPQFDDGRSVLYLTADCHVTKECIEETLEEMNVEHRTVSKKNYMPMHTIRSKNGSWIFNGLLFIYFILQWARSMFFRFSVDRLPHLSHIEVERRCTNSHLETTAYELVLSQRGLLESTVSRLIGSGYGTEPKFDISSGSFNARHHVRAETSGIDQLTEFMRESRAHSAFSIFFSICTLFLFSFYGLFLVISPMFAVAPILVLYSIVALCLFAIASSHLDMKGILFFSAFFSFYSFFLLFAWPYCFYKCSKNKNRTPQEIGPMESADTIQLNRFKKEGLSESNINKIISALRNLD